MANSVCLTKKQAEFFKYISEYKKANGYYPGIAEAAKVLKRSPASVVSSYGNLFLRGAFTDGKGQTRFHANAHIRLERKAAKKPAGKKAEKPPVTNKQLADLLVKLLSGGDTSRDGAINAILANL